MPPLLDHSRDARRSRGIPPMMIAWIILMAVAACAGAVLFVRSLTAQSFETGHISGFHAEHGLTFVHYGILEDIMDDRRLAFLIFEPGDGQNLEPSASISAQRDIQFLIEIPRFTLTHPGGRTEPVPFGEGSPNVFRYENGDLTPLDFSVSLTEWRAYESRYREIGDGNLSAENLRRFIIDSRDSTLPTSDS